jgi:curved DNA-binding protein CbpA
MTDCFSLFNEPRRPWLDPDELKEKLHKLSAQHHPDVAGWGGIDFAELNAAYRTLHDPKNRLRHFIDLEFPGSLDRQLDVPRDIGRLFETVGRERHSVAGFLEKKVQMKKPVEAALLEPEKLGLLVVLGKLLELLIQKREGFFMQLRFLDTIWEDDRAKSEPALIEIYQSISYIGKWIVQVREDILKVNE